MDFTAILVISSELIEQIQSKGKYSVSDNNQIVLFSPDSDLAPNTQYTVFLSGKDNCKSGSNKSNDEKSSAIQIEEHGFILPNLINPTSIERSQILYLTIQNLFML